MFSGKSAYDGDKWNSYSSTKTGKSYTANFTKRSLSDDLNPRNIGFRESLDSTVSLNSTPTILASDVTGSMGDIANILISRGLGDAFEQIKLNKGIEQIKLNKGIESPQVMAMAVGDELEDKAPLQITQFETDPVVLAKQMENIYVEGGGGGNTTEGYSLPWLFAAHNVKMDAFEKRGEKGFLFTIGDESVPRDLDASTVAKIFGQTIAPRNYPVGELLGLVRKKFHVFHVGIKTGSYVSYDSARHWSNLLGQNFLPLDDYNELGTVVAATIAIINGVDKAAVYSTVNKTALNAVQSATKHLVPVVKTNSGSTGLVRF